MNRRLNLNADLGESFGPWEMGSDAEMLGIVGSANVACGYHAGDPLVMTSTAALALKHGVSVGAHPGSPDLHGFGRRRLDIPLPELEAQVMRKLNAAKGGGYIVQSDHSVPSNCSAERYEFVLNLVRKHGKYPLQLGAYDIPDVK